MTSRAAPTGGAPRCDVLVVGLGLEMAGDDGIGPAVLARLRADGAEGAHLLVLAEPVGLLHRLDGVGHLVVVDAIRSSAPVGSVQVVDVDDVVPGPVTSSSHGLGLAEVLRLATALSARPERCTVVGVTGRRFAPGSGMSPEVAAAVGPAAARVGALIRPSVPAGGVARTG